MRIGAYECLTPFATAGSGSARWCVALRDERKYFLKQFLAPVRPDAFSTAPPALRRRQRARCDAFERRKKTLFEALGCVLGDCVAPVTDFFVFEGHYYAVSEYVPEPLESFETLGKAPQEALRPLLFSLAQCLGRVHAQGIVHADLKPEHVLVIRNEVHIRLIDFDSGFLENDPPAQDAEIDGDPVYLAPETFLCMTGERHTLNRKIDTFAFGILAHRLCTGRLPEPEEGAYAYEAALAGRTVRLAGDLPAPLHWMIGKALSADPMQRPEDGVLERLLAPPAFTPGPAQREINGLSRLFHTEKNEQNP